MAEKFTLKHLVVTDDVTGEDIGVAIVRHGMPGCHIKNWLTFPDGSVRGMYDYRPVPESDADLLVAFGSLPELKVSYRPIAKFFDERDYMAFVIMLVFWLLCMAAGLTLMTAVAHGKIDQLVGLPFVPFLSGLLLGGAVASTIGYLLISQVATARRNHRTSDDEKAHNLVWEHRDAENEKKKEQEKKKGLTVLV